MKPSAVGVVDYGAGNFASVWNALDFLGAPIHPVRQASEIEQASHLVLPGVGSFKSCISRLRTLRLEEPIRKAVSTGKPFLGICVGMQITATTGLEFGVHEGLDLIPGEVRAIQTRGLDLPHIGWNNCRRVHSSPLLGEEEEPDFYFLHSFHLVTTDDSNVVAVTDYGEEITAIVQRDNVFGVQFHPEKSQRAGLQLLKRFTRLS